MFDRDLVLTVLRQIDQATDTIQSRTRDLHDPDDFTDTTLRSRSAPAT